MKTRVLIGVLVVALAFLAYQVFNFMDLAQKAQSPIEPGKRFAVPPNAPTQEEIDREERRLEQLNAEARAKATKQH